MTEEINYRFIDEEEIDIEDGLSIDEFIIKLADIQKQIQEKGGFKESIQAIQEYDDIKTTVRYLVSVSEEEKQRRIKFDEESAARRAVSEWKRLELYAKEQGYIIIPIEKSGQPVAPFTQRMPF